MSKILTITAVVLLLILSLSSFAFSEETLTITTYYPSPYGRYKELAAQQMKIGTTYSSGGVSPDNLIVEGNVGIGTSTPQTKLDVAGGIKPGGVSDSNCNLSMGGTIRWSASDTELQYCDGALWQSITKEVLPATCVPGSTYDVAYKQCSCGIGTYVWEDTQTCTCQPDGISWSCPIPDCLPKPPGAPC